jgi:4'-phosphopantetheinyl transferase
MPSSRDMIWILYSEISESNHLKILQNFLPKLNQLDQEKIKRFKRWQDAQASLLGRILLIEGCKILNYYLNINELKITGYGKPYFENTHLKFNISHSWNIVVCALTNKYDVGVDIEQISHIQLKDFRGLLTDQEWIHINTCANPICAFYNIWTQKEASVKAHGKGILTPMQSFEVNNNTTIIEGKKFYIKELQIDPRYACHLAFPRKNIAISKVNYINIIIEKNYIRH